MNNNITAAKKQRQDVLRVLDEVGAKKIKAERVVMALQAARNSLADVQDQIDNIHRDSLATSKTTIFLPVDLAKKYERLLVIDKALSTAFRRKKALAEEWAVTLVAVEDTEAAIRLAEHINQPSE